MTALLIVGIVLASVLTYVIIGSAVGNYAYNHMASGYDISIGATAMAVFWPVFIWPILGWAFGVRPDFHNRRDPFLWHHLTVSRAARVGRGTRKQLERRAAINQMEDNLGLVRTRWEDAP